MASLAWLPYQKAMLVWLILAQLGLFLTLRFLFNLNSISLFVWFFISLLWYPIHDDLAMGQIMVIVLALIVVGWKQLQRDQPIYAGLLIGLALSLKLIFWPLVVYFCIKRRFRFVAYVCGTFAVANLSSALIIGFDRLTYYYLHVGSLVADFYKASPFNFSMLSVGPRIFSGTRSTLASLLQSDPFVHAPELAFITSAFLALLISCPAFYFAVRCKEEERGFGALLSLSIILSPTSWWFYFVLLLIPIKTAASLKGWFAKIVISCCLFATYIPLLVQPIFGVHVSAWAGLLMLCPLVAVCLMIGTLLSPELRSFCQERLSRRPSSWQELET
jgi:hypothetical protein